MRTAFIILIPVENSLSEPRLSCEQIENTVFNIGDVEPTSMVVLEKVMHELGVNDRNNIEVWALTDFMDWFNDEQLNPDDYFMTYVYTDK